MEEKKKRASNNPKGFTRIADKREEFRKAKKRDPESKRPSLKNIRKMHGKRMLDFMDCLRAQSGLVSLGIKEFVKRFPNQKPILPEEHSIWVSNDVGYSKSYQAIKDGVIDVAEGTLLMMIRNESFPAVQYYLNHMGKKRGYNSEIQVQMAHSGTIKHEVVVDFSERPE